MTGTNDGCGFCGRTEDEGGSHYLGPAARICSSCADLCWDIIGPERARLGVTADAPSRPVTECAFCGRDDAEPKVSGPRLFICARCVADARSARPRPS